jgi:hypothetical protein
MAYTGFISDPSYCRNNESETITAKWVFNNDIHVSGNAKFDKLIDGTAMYANWGDLAEKYSSDESEAIVKGTLVKFGGSSEITKVKPNDRNFFGVVSSKPGVVLNKSNKDGIEVALIGKVPVRVIGKVKKFDKLTTSYITGVAKKKTLLDILLLKPTVGIALESSDNDNEKMIESFVKANM